MPNVRLSAHETDFDDDFGPIRFEGNIFTRALETTTDPFFNRLGVENPFSRFQTATAVSGLSVKNDPLVAGLTTRGASEIVPEPTTAVLMLGGLLAVGRRRRR